MLFPAILSLNFFPFCKLVLVSVVIPPTRVRGKTEGKKKRNKNLLSLLGREQVLGWKGLAVGFAPVFTSRGNRVFRSLSATFYCGGLFLSDQPDFTSPLLVFGFVCLFIYLFFKEKDEKENTIRVAVFFFPPARLSKLREVAVKTAAASPLLQHALAR